VEEPKSERDLEVNKGLRDGSEAYCEYNDKVGEALEGKDSIQAPTFPPRIVAVLRKTVKRLTRRRMMDPDNFVGTCAFREDQGRKGRINQARN